MKAKNITGKKYWMLTVLEQVEPYISPQGYRYSKWKCVCDCGKETHVRTSTLTSGHTKSCGCLQSKKAEEREKVKIKSALKRGEKFRICRICKIEKPLSSFKRHSSGWRRICRQCQYQQQKQADLQRETREIIRNNIKHINENICQKLGVTERPWMNEIEINVDEDLAYIIGVYFGDGSINQRTPTSKAFVLQVKDKEFRDVVGDAAKRVFKHSAIYMGISNRPRIGTVYSLRVGRVGDFIEEVCGQNRAKIPKFIYSTQGYKLAFLGGLMDSDGWVSYKHFIGKNEAYISLGFSTTNPIAKNIKKSFENAGILVGKTTKKTLKSEKISQTWFLNTDSIIKSHFNFGFSRKQKPLDNYIKYKSGTLTREEFIGIMRQL